MKPFSIASFASPIGELFIKVCDEGLMEISYTVDSEGFNNKPHPLIEATKQQLTEYFNKRRQVFDIHIYIKGTSFRKNVWKQLQAIPHGQVKTYGEIAKSMAKPNASRAVGGACHNNPISIIIPCHRVVGSTGKLTGYAGGLDKKQWLLQHEAQVIGLKKVA